MTVATDLTQLQGVERVVRETVERFGGLDILVNSVGRAGGGGLLETSDDEWASAFDHTLYPAIRASRLAVPHMRKRGGGGHPHHRVDLGSRVRRSNDIQRCQGR